MNVVTFVGKSIRQWNKDRRPRGWGVRLNGWWLGVGPSRDGMLPFYWALSRNGAMRISHEGYASSLREAEQAADAAIQVGGPAQIGRCAVCLEPAFDVKVSYVQGKSGRVVYVCPRHKTVCRAHLKDPCPECGVSTAESGVAHG